MAELEAGLAEVARVREETLQQVSVEFDRLDADGSGAVDRAELIEVSKKQAGERVSEEKLNEFFSSFDANNDGKVTRQEWLDFFGRLYDQQVAPVIAAAKAAQSQ